jgi:hypothetical protein
MGRPGSPVRCDWAFQAVGTAHEINPRHRALLAGHESRSSAGTGARRAHVADLAAAWPGFCCTRFHRAKAFFTL